MKKNECSYIVCEYKLCPMVQSALFTLIQYTPTVCYTNFHMGSIVEAIYVPLTKHMPHH